MNSFTERVLKNFMFSVRAMIKSDLKTRLYQVDIFREICHVINTYIFTSIFSMTHTIYYKVQFTTLHTHVALNRRLFL